jgi:hypothetical protein
MAGIEDQGFPPELERLGERLHLERPERSALELDRIKSRIRGSAAPSRAAKGPLAGRRGLALALITGTVLAGGGATIAASGPFSTHGHSAAKSEYRPGKGCGDKNHIHKRHGECKPKHHHGHGGHKH